MKIIKTLKLSLVATSLAATSALANGTVPAAMPNQPAQNVSAVSLYAGFGAGYQGLRGKRQDLARARVISTKTKLNGGNAAAILFAGLKWHPNANFSFSLEPYYSHSHIKTIASGISSVGALDSYQVSTKHNYGLDFKPALHTGNGHSFYVLLGLDRRKFSTNFFNFITNIPQGFAFHGRKQRVITGFSYGLGYEYEMGKSLVGVRFKHTLYGRKTLATIDSGATPVSSRIKPHVFNAMLTYSYRLYG